MYSEASIQLIIFFHLPSNNFTCAEAVFLFQTLYMYLFAINKVIIL